MFGLTGAKIPFIMSVQGDTNVPLFDLRVRIFLLMLPHSHLLNMENEKLREHAEEIVSHMVGPEMTKLGRGSKKIVENTTRRSPIFQ